MLTDTLKGYDCPVASRGITAEFKHAQVMMTTLQFHPADSNCERYSDFIDVKYEKLHLRLMRNDTRRKPGSSTWGKVTKNGKSVSRIKDYFSAFLQFILGTARNCFCHDIIPHESLTNWN